MAAIPAEIYSAIFQWVADRQDLCYAACASRIMNFEAERRLYNSIAPRTPIQLVKIARAIIPNPTRQGFVRQLDVTISTHPVPRFRSFMDSALSRLLSKLLRVLPQLKALRLHQWPCWTLEACHHPFLEVLDLCTIPVWPSGESEAILLDFKHAHSYLERHHTIMHLSLDSRNGCPGECDLPSSALPSLVTLTCAGEHFPSGLFQKKSIERLALLNPESTALNQILNIYPSILKLGKALCVMELSRCSREWSSRLESSDDLDLMGECLPHLQYLALPAPVGNDEQLLSWADRLSSTISQFWPQLMIFRLQFEQGDAQTNLGVPGIIANKVISIRASLKWVIIMAWRVDSSRMDLMVHQRGCSPMPYYKDHTLKSALFGLGIRYDEYGPLICFTTDKTWSEKAPRKFTLMGRNGQQLSAPALNQSLLAHHQTFMAGANTIWATI